jgi:hypothetical protein
MPRKCPTGFICSDTTTIWLVAIGVIALTATAWSIGSKSIEKLTVRSEPPAVPRERVIIVQSPPPALPQAQTVQQLRPDLYPEPVQRIAGVPLPFRSVPAGPYQQVGILTAEGGSSSSAAPDRTILPLYGRELDSRRSRWNYYTRTDGQNPVQVPIRVQNRSCDDDTNGCQELFSDDSVHVPALGRSFKTTVYRKTLFA